MWGTQVATDHANLLVELLIVKCARFRLFFYNAGCNGAYQPTDDGSRCGPWRTCDGPHDGSRNGPCDGAFGLMFVATFRVLGRECIRFFFGFHRSLPFLRALSARLS